MNKLILITSIATLGATVGLMTPAFAQQSAPMDAAPPAQSELGSPSTTGSMNNRSAANPSTSGSQHMAPSSSSSMRMGSGDENHAAISAMNLGTDKVREVQQALKDKNNADLTVDGMWGPQTQDAIRDFQRSENLDPSNGQLNEKTVSALGLDPDDFSGR